MHPQKDFQIFKYDTSTFKLTINYNKEKLLINLEDLDEWFSYHREYTQEDIGKEIHKKVELNDLFETFLSTKSDQDNIKQRQIGLIINQYRIGDIVYNQDTPCFKIGHNGVITVYVCLQKRSSKQIVKYESVLHLQKQAKMDEKQILAEKSAIQIRTLKTESNRKIQALNTQIQRLLIENMELKAANQKLKQQNIQLKAKNVESIKQQNRTPQNAEQQFINLKKQLSNSVSLQNITNLIQPNSNKFNITSSSTNCRLQYKGQNLTMTQFIFKQIIPYNKLYSFKIKIVKTQSKYIVVGIIDEPKQIKQRQSRNSKNAVCYDGYGCKYPAGVNQGTGFRQGDTVETTVYLANKRINWSIGGVTRATYIYQPLGDQTRTFRPFIQMFNTNDIIQFQL